MAGAIALYDRITAMLSSRLGEGIALLATRIALAGVFWRSGRTKVEEGSLLEVSDSTLFLFEHEYSGVPILSPELAAVLATWSETLFPVLLLVGLATRFSAFALLGMTLAIQIFVYPDAWWSVHSLWVAMALILISRGAGLLSVDELFNRPRETRRTR